MKLLALDTSTELCSAALDLDGELVQRAVMAENRHSELLLPMVRELLATAGLNLRDLDGLAYGRGPGSFTGLRIACGVVQGLAFGADLPVLGVVTLEAMALEAATDNVLTCIDARMHEVYAAAYHCRGNELEQVVPPAVLRPEALELPGRGTWVGCGTGFAAYSDLLRERLGPRLVGVDTEVYPHARSIARLARPRFAAGEAAAAEFAEPLYVRDKVALTIRER